MILSKLFHYIKCDACGVTLHEDIECDDVTCEPVAFCRKKGWLVDERTKRCICDSCIAKADIANSVADDISKANIEKGQAATDDTAVLVEA